MGGVVFLALVTATLVLVAYGVWRRLQLRSMELVWRETEGLARIELRRVTEMRSHVDGGGGVSFPEPTETRSLTWLCCELPLWSKTESIGLPSGSEGRISEVRAEEFDPHFTADFRIVSGHVAKVRGLLPSRIRHQSSTPSAI